MTDVNEHLPHEVGEPARVTPSRDIAAPSGETALFDFAELLFFAYRDFIGDPDAILAEFGFGRAHHRVLHFVNRQPGLRVADLLEILKITKQSLGRVLKELVDNGFVLQRAGEQDRRERLLYATAPGRALAERLARPQLDRLATALSTAGPNGKAAVRQFLQGMTAASGGEPGARSEDDDR